MDCNVVTTTWLGRITTTDSYGGGSGSITTVCRRMNNNNRKSFEIKTEVLIASDVHMLGCRGYPYPLSRKKLFTQISQLEPDVYRLACRAGSNK